MSSTMVSDLETDLPDEDEEEEEEDEDEGYGARHPRGLEHTPGSSMDNLDSSLTGKKPQSGSCQGVLSLRCDLLY